MLFFHKRRTLSVIIFKYLTKEILLTLFSATLILLVIVLTNQSVQMLEHAAVGELPATVLLQLISLQIPLLLPYLLPMGLYLGILLTLGRMHLESEMTVLSACGMSRLKLTGMVLMVATVIAGIVLWLMASVVPKAQGEVNYITGKAAVTASVGQVIPGQFMTFGKGDKQVVFYAGSTQNHKIMHHVFMAKKIRDSSTSSIEKWSVLVAQEAQEKKNYYEHGNFVIFDHGDRYAGRPGEKQYQIMQFDRYGLRLSEEGTPDYNLVQSDSFSTLWSKSPKDRGAAAELQWRMAMPISVLLFALIAMPLSEIQPRFGKFTQLFPAIVIYVIYADSIYLARDWIRVGKISPTWGMGWMHGAMLLLIGLLILYRVGWKRICYFFRKKQ